MSSIRNERSGFITDPADSVFFDAGLIASFFTRTSPSSSSSMSTSEDSESLFSGTGKSPLQLLASLFADVEFGMLVAWTCPSLAAAARLSDDRLSSSSWTGDRRPAVLLGQLLLPFDDSMS